MEDKLPIYLDHNATTPLLPQVVEAMLPYLRDHFGNPSSGHVYGRSAKDAVERARAQVAALLGSDADELFFTGGGTEANNLAIRGVMEARADRRELITTVVEHPATARPCDWLEKHGVRVHRVGVDAAGRARVAEVEAAAGQGTALITVMHSNKETGVLQPVAEMARVARKVGAVTHTDAAQSLGKVPVRVRELDVDLLSVAGHKLYAPKGVGALYIRRGTPLTPLVLGAGHEHGVRPGTENVASIVALGMACELAGADLDAVATRVAGLRDRLWELLRTAVPGLALTGHPTLRLPNTLHVRFPGVAGNTVLEHAPEVAASTGSACHDGQHAAPAVVVAMGVSSEDAVGSVRLTLGRGTTVQDVELAAAALVRAWSARQQT